MEAFERERTSVMKETLTVLLSFYTGGKRKNATGVEQEKGLSAGRASTKTMEGDGSSGGPGIVYNADGRIEVPLAKDRNVSTVKREVIKICRGQRQ